MPEPTIFSLASSAPGELVECRLDGEPDATGGEDEPEVPS